MFVSRSSAAKRRQDAPSTGMAIVLASLACWFSQIALPVSIMLHDRHAALTCPFLPSATGIAAFATALRHRRINVRSGIQ